MGKKRKTAIAAGCALVALAVALPLAVVSKGEASPVAKKRELFMSAVEWKGSASVSKEPYPGPVPAGGGYESCPPGSQDCDLAGNTAKWAIETYRFDTAVVAAYDGERVILNVFGVNSAKHDIVIPGLKKTFTVKRGVVSRIDLGVVKAGIYTIICVTHPPSHRADLVVLPKNG